MRSFARTIIPDLSFTALSAASFVEKRKKQNPWVTNDVKQNIQRINLKEMREL